MFPSLKNYSIVELKEEKSKEKILFYASSTQKCDFELLVFLRLSFSPVQHLPWKVKTKLF